MGHEQRGLRIDIGCGSIKKQGTIGVDIEPLPEADYVVDIERQPLPFKDRSVAYVHSSHFLEHVENVSFVFSEISRVCEDNARLELWTPYAWSNSAFILGHKTFFTEDIYLHMCFWYTDFWEKILHAQWILSEFQYVIEAPVLLYLQEQKVSLDFALRHCQNIVKEFCAHITVLHDKPKARLSAPRRTFSTGRFSPRYEIKSDESAPLFGLADQKPATDAAKARTEEAIRRFAASKALPPLG